MARQIGNSPAFKIFGAQFHDKVFPLCKDKIYDSDEYWECYVKSMTTTDHHPVGTCKMGPKSDPFAVVSPQTLKVYGLQNLRVVDASVMPTIPSGNIQIPIIMMAEKAADIIKSNYP